MARSAAALHHQAYLVLRDRLASGVWRSGDRLPSEAQLCAEFGVSRITLRRAIEALEREGLLRRVQGKGTFATTEAALFGRDPLLGGMGSDLEKISAATRARVLAFDLVEADDRVAALLSLDDDREVRYSVRLRQKGREPLMRIDAWVPAALGRGWRRRDLQTVPLYSLLARAGVRFGRVVQEIGARPAGPQMAEQLRVRVGDPLLQIRRLVQDRQGRPVEYVELYACPDRTKMLFDIPAERIDDVSSGRFVLEPG